MEKERIIIVVQGGLIQSVSIPEKANCVVVVMDYDTDDPNAKIDEDGEKYFESEWE